MAHFNLIVVGSGISGLSCAKLATEKAKNHDKSFEILLLEAQEYVGGRIKQNSDFLDGLKIDLGAEFIHGGTTKLCKLARQLDINLEPLFCWAQGDGGPLDSDINGGYGLYYIGENDQLIRYDDSSDEFKTCNNTLEQLGYLVSESYPPSLSLKDYYEQNKFSSFMTNMADAGYSNTLCANSEELSLNQTIKWNNYWFHGGADNEEEESEREHEGDFRLGNTYYDIVQHLSNGLDIRTNCPVTNVDYSRNPIEITTATGERFTCDRIVITAPPHVFNSNKMQFTPSLPAAKTNALSYLKMNSAMKIVLKFSKRFWPSRLHGMICSDSEIPEYWYVDLGDPSCPRKIENINDNTDSKIECYVIAFASAKFAEKLLKYSEEERVKKALNQLDKIYSKLEKKHFNPTPGDQNPQEQVNLPTPSDVFLGGMSYVWSTETHPFIGGGYASPSVGIPEDYGRILREPIQNKVFFAGEHTAEGAGATACAAFRSGYATAEIVINSF